MLQVVISRKGTVPPEIFLRVLECMDYEPGMIEKIMRTCKVFRDLLIRYEYSISRKLAISLYPSSKPWSSSPKRSPLLQSTYPWLHEVYTRTSTVSLLKTSSLLSLDHPHLPASVKTNLYLQERILSLLYDFSDLGSSTGEQTSINGVREAQETWIECELRSREELAIIYGMLTVISDGWRTSLLESSALAKVPTDAAHISELHSLQIEEECVYRECCLTYGPYFMKASLENSAWFEKVMTEGMKDLRDFEGGEIENCRESLQGMVFKRFCGLVGCESMDGWSEILRVFDSFSVNH